MIIKNINFFSIQSRILNPKGLNFSSLYQTANFSSNNLLDTRTSLEATAISNKANSSNAYGEVQDLNKKQQNIITERTNNIIVKQGLGPINNGYAKKLLDYKFLAPSSTAIVEHKQVYSEDIIKLISAFFKSIYCLISRPKFINTADKIIIEILYYITIPDNNIFKWYNFIYKMQNSNKVSDQQNIRKNKKKPTIKTILYKNYFIKKTLFKLNNTNIVNLYFNKFAILFNLLQCLPNINTSVTKNNRIFGGINKPIEFNLIRIHKSDYDSNILAQLFILILKKKNIRIAINKIYNKNNIQNKASAIATGNIYNNNGQYIIPFLPTLEGLGPNSAIAYISGLYIKIGGRLMREPIIPRLTTKNFEMGAIATGKVNFVDSARITKKNKKGAFTIKITYAQNFVF